MSFFQLRSLPGSVWPAVPHPQVSLVWNAYQQLDRTQWMRPEQIEQMQLQQLNALLAHARKNVPYYAGLLHEDPITSPEALRKLPVLTRELYQSNFEQIQARALPEGMTAGDKGSFTSGTSGVPIKVLKTNRDALWWSALFLRDLEWCNIDPKGKLAVIRLLAYKPQDLPAAMAGATVPHWNPSVKMLIDTGPCAGIDIRLDPRKQLDWLRREQPDYLLSMPTNLEVLSSLVRESGEPLSHLKMIQAIGEPMSAEMRMRIESGFGVPVKNIYSTTEGGYIASQCPDGHGLHVHSETVLCEVLDAHNNPCKPGETGRLVFTNLHNFRTPFIRYEIQDEVTLAAAPCPCGRGLPLWLHVEGRRYPNLRLADGRKKSSIGIVLGLRQVGGVHQFQMIQRELGRAIVRVVPDQTWTPEHPNRIREVMQREFESPIDVQIEQRPYLERLAGGKLKIVVVEME